MNERFAWAIDVLDLRSADDVLEIGCGTGILAQQILKRLSRGRMVAVDKSATMIESARRRNLVFTSNRKLELIQGNLADLQFKSRMFDVVVAFNVSLFWKILPKN